MANYQHASAPAKPATDDEARGGGSGGAGAPPHGGLLQGNPAEQGRQPKDPCSNTGLAFVALNTESVGSESGRFDYYAASARIDPEQLVDGLADALGVVEKRSGRGQHGYSAAVDLIADGRVVARVLYGGRNPVPHAYASGQDAVAFATAMRERFPDHWVTRVDVAIDFDAVTAFDRLTGIALAVADQHDLRISQAGDWVRDGIAGRTLYVGSFRSPLLVRIYEKGKHIGGDASQGWVRVELQVRPKNRARISASKAVPAEFWGFGRWPAALADQLGLAQVERVSMWERQQPDQARTMDYVVSHFFRALLWWRDHHGGSWEAAGAELGRRVEMHAHRRKK